MPITDIVDVQISLQAGTVSRAGFGTCLIVGSHKRFNERIKFYSSLTAMADDFESTDKEYIAASDLFAQSPQPTQVAVGRRKVDDPVTITVSEAHDSTDYDVYVNGTKLTYTSGVGATVTSIATGLVAAIDAGSEPVDATDGSGGNFTVSHDVAGTAWSLKVGDYITVPAFTVTEAIGDTMDAIVNISDAFYGVILTDRTEATVLLLAAWIETKKKIFFTASSDSEIINTTLAADTGSLPKQLKDLAYERTACFYSATAATEYLDAGSMGQIMPNDPGSYTLKFKTISSVTVDVLNDTEKANALAKNCNTYTEVGGVNIIENGTMAKPQFVDVVVFIDWLQARMTERIFSRMTNLPKIPFTDKGVAIIEGEIKAQLQQGIDRGGLKDDPAPTVTVPLVKDVSSVDKAARTLPDVTFTAELAGAIHKTIIRGTISV